MRTVPAKLLRALLVVAASLASLGGGVRPADAADEFGYLASWLELDGIMGYDFQVLQANEHGKKAYEYPVSAGPLKPESDWRQAYTTEFVQDLAVKLD